MLSKIELMQVEGGVMKWGLVTLIGSLLSFIMGAIDGYFNPNKCK